jgi:hypothetical protein
MSVISHIRQALYLAQCFNIASPRTRGLTRMKNSSLQLPLYACLLLIAACDKDAEVVVYDDKALADEAQTANWLAYGRTHNERRFSPSDQVNTGNVAKLKVDWFLDLPNDVGLVSTPLVVDGTLYFTGTMNVIRAVDAVSGELLWEYDPKVADAIKGKRRAGWKHNRGISFYEGKLFAATWDGRWKHNRGISFYEGKLFAATWDGRLFALDAKTGEELWLVRTFDIDRALYITGAPKAFNGKVLIGNGPTTPTPVKKPGSSISSPAIPPMASRTRPWKWPPGPGPVNGGDTAVAVTPGTVLPTTPNSMPFTSVPAMARHGIARSAAPEAATTCSCVPSLRWMPTRVSTCGTTRPRRANPGITTPTWTSCLPTCSWPMTTNRSRPSCMRPRTVSFM